jgi:hypothetical protein
MWPSQMGVWVEIEGNKHFQANKDIVTLDKFELALKLSPKGPWNNAMFHMLPIFFNVILQDCNNLVIMRNYIDIVFSLFFSIKG